MAPVTNISWYCFRFSDKSWSLRDKLLPLQCVSNNNRHQFVTIIINLSQSFTVDVDSKSYIVVEFFHCAYIDVDVNTSTKILHSSLTCIIITENVDVDCRCRLSLNSLMTTGFRHSCSDNADVGSRQSRKILHFKFMKFETQGLFVTSVQVKGLIIITALTSQWLLTNSGALLRFESAPLFFSSRFSIDKASQCSTFRKQKCYTVSICISNIYSWILVMVSICGGNNSHSR